MANVRALTAGLAVGFGASFAVWPHAKSKSDVSTAMARLILAEGRQIALTNSLYRRQSCREKASRETTRVATGNAVVDGQDAVCQNRSKEPHDRRRDDHAV